MLIRRSAVKSAATSAQRRSSPAQRPRTAALRAVKTQLSVEPAGDAVNAM